MRSLEGNLGPELSKLHQENDDLKKKLIAKECGIDKVDSNVSSSPTSKSDLTPWTMSMRIQNKISEKGFLERVINKLDVKMITETPEVNDKWTLVTIPKPEDQEKDALDCSELSGDYVMLSECDVVDAIADLVVRCANEIQGSTDISTESLRQRLNKSFDELHQKKGLIRKTWNWVTFLRRAGSWSTTAFQIYSDPVLAQLIATSVVTSATWIGLGSNLATLAASILLQIGQNVMGVNFRRFSANILLKLSHTAS